MRDGFNDVLQCFWDKWVFISPTEIELYIPKYNAPDMVGCIDTAKSLIPEVRVINVFEDGSAIINYKFDGYKWNVLVLDRLMDRKINGDCDD